VKSSPGESAASAARPRSRETPAEAALRLGPLYRGKIQTVPKVPVRGLADLAIWYTPGVAAQCRAIEADPAAAYELTNKANTVAVVSDGSRVLGLGDIGPLAGLPVMEGKALLFKVLGGVDAVPLCLATREPGDLARAVEWIAPSFGGVNLEDVAQPKCFDVLARVRRSLDIPVWHDDQQGTAVVVVAGVRNALRVVGKRLAAVKIAMLGCGAANTASYRLLVAAGAEPRAFTICDRQGVLHPERADLAALGASAPHKAELALATNGEGVRGGMREALRGADVCIAFSEPKPGLIRPAWVREMARDPIVLACANPEPEIWPQDALAAGARVVATGRSDFPNQLNNSLVFPGVFRGALDVRARAISDGMALAAAEALERLGQERGLSAQRIVPAMTDVDTALRVAVAAGSAASAEGLARAPLGADELERRVRRTLAAARAQLDALVAAGSIALPPEV
jgi:malate dehydrogenase (oxaloacetate-decarboxylating)